MPDELELDELLEEELLDELEEELLELDEELLDEGLGVGSSFPPQATRPPASSATQP